MTLENSKVITSNVKKKKYNPFDLNSLFREHWKGFKERNISILRDIEVKEVEKMLPCRDESRGFWTCYCQNCDIYHNVYFGCNSRICSCCGKRYADNWAEKLVENTFDVAHKHAVFGLPPLLWNELRYHSCGMSFVIIETLGK